MVAFTWLGFVADRQLKRIPLEGGAPLTICEVCRPYGYGVDWLPDDTIVMGDDVWVGAGLQRVPVEGGTATPLTTLEDGEAYHRWPSVLPDGRSVIFTVVDDRGQRLEVVDVQTGRRRKVEGLAGASRPRYLESGHLLYTYGRELWAAPFDLNTLAAGPGAARIHDFPFYSLKSRPFAVSRSGTLAYLTGSGQPRRRLVWVDRRGERKDFGADPGYFWNPRLSPDGKRLAVDVQTGDKLDVWIFDIVSGRRERLTSNGRSCYPHWMPDGRIGYAVRTDWHPEPLWGVLNARPTEGLSREAEVLLSYPYGAPGSWTADGQLIFEIWGNNQTGYDLWSLAPDGTSGPWLETQYQESQPELSPDGRWLAYSSTETGEWEIFVASFPDGRRKVRLSSNGGVAPVWSADGRELFYREGGWLMRVPWSARTDSAVEPTRVFAEPYWLGNVTHMERNYDVAPDGRFLMLEPVEEGPGEPSQIVVVQNWFEELRRIVPVE